MKISIRRAIVASSTAVAAVGIVFAAPATAFAAPPQIIHDDGVFTVEFDDVHDQAEEAIEEVADGFNNIVPGGVVKFRDLRGPRSILKWNPNPINRMECTQAEEASGMYLCWEIVDD